MMKMWRCLILVLMGLSCVTAAPLESDEGWGTQDTQDWFKDYMMAKDLAEEAKDGLSGQDDEYAIGKEL